VATPEKVLKEWNDLPAGERTRSKARELAKKARCQELGKKGYFKSMGEVRIACELRKLKRQKKIKKWAYEPEQWSYQFKVQHYTPDFKITRLDDTDFMVEYKGKMVKQVRDKLLAIQNCNPDKDLKLCFERGANKIARRSKTTYLKWAADHGFDVADGSIKEEWL